MFWQFGLSRRRFIGVMSFLVPTYSFAKKLDSTGAVTVFSDSIIHPVPTEHVAHCFHDSDLTTILAKDSSKVVVHHGMAQKFEGYKSFFSHIETLPVFWNKFSGVEDISMQMLFRILSSDVNNWAELGGDNLPINVYVPDDTIKFRALEKQLEMSGFILKPARFEREDYATQAKSIISDPGGLALGLRSEIVHGLANEVSMKIPQNRDGGYTFGVPMHLYVRENDDEAVSTAERLLKETAKRAAADGSTYPLEKSLKQLLDG